MIYDNDNVMPFHFLDGVGSMKKNRNAAFTLIELLIVVAIIGILAAIAVPNFLNAQIRAKIAQCYGNMKSLQTAIGIYETDWSWPPMDRGTEYADGSSYKALTTPVAYMSPYGLVTDIFPPKSDTEGRRFYDYGASLRLGAEPNTTSGQERVREYKSAGVSYVVVSSGPDGDTDWPWTDWQGGLRALNNPTRAGSKGDGGAFFNASNGVGSSGDIVSSSARIYQ